MQKAAWKTTSPYCQKATDNNLPLRIKELVQERRRARRMWQRTRDPYERRYLNTLTHRLHAAIQAFKNAIFDYYI
jgi:predicted component of type VI protein secretion system